MTDDYFKGKGAQLNPINRFKSQYMDTSDPDGLDEKYLDRAPKVQVFYDRPKKILSPYDSPDLGKGFSINAYQGCEHGCTYCYARVSHQYWGFDAGLDFESRIMVKEEAPHLLRKELSKKKWKPTPIMMSGNTDCYQPLERTFELTRGILQVLNQFRNPVGIITKNTLIERDMDLLSDMARDNLVRVIFSLNSLNEDLRRRMEPRTASSTKKLRLIQKLTEAGIPTGIMIAPIVPGLNHHEIPAILKAAGEAGAVSAGYTVVRLNGEIQEIFEDWLTKNYPDKKDKVLNQVRALHGGQLNDSRFGKRLKGEGEHSRIIKQLFETSKRKFIGERQLPPLNLTSFRRGGVKGLFD